MRRLLTMGATCVATMALVPTAGAHYRNEGAQKCGYVSFQEGTDYGASDVRARRTSCKTARQLVLRATFSDSKYPYGYTCRFRSRTNGDRQSGMGHGDVRCAKNYTTEGGKKRMKVVTWAVS